MNSPRVFALSSEAKTEYHRAQYEAFADRLGLTVAVDAPHSGSGTTAGDMRYYRQSPHDFTLLFFTAPRSQDGDVSSLVLSRMGLNTGGYALLDAYYQDDERQPRESHLTDFGSRTDMSFVGTLPLSDYASFFTEQALAGAALRVTDGIFGDVPPVAIVYDKAAFIPYDLVHTEDYDGLIATILTDIANLLAGTLGTQGERQRARQMAFVEHWVQYSATRTLMQSTKEIEALTLRANEAKALMVQAHREREIEIIKAEALRRGPQAITEAEQRGVQRLLDKGVITRIIGRGDALDFETRILYALDERTNAYHEIGAMSISVNPTTAGITFRNMTHGTAFGMGDGMQAPHVFSSGNPCMGNFSEMAAALSIQRDWLGMIELAIAFVETANTRDAAGRYVHTWPFVHDPVSVGLPAYSPSVEPFIEEDHDGPPDEDNEGEVWVRSIMLEDIHGTHVTRLTLSHDGAERLTVYFDDAGGDYDTGVGWSSSDHDVATVDRRGYVTAVGPGDATIYAQSHFNAYAEAEVFVEVLPAPEDDDEVPAVMAEAMAAAL